MKGLWHDEGFLSPNQCAVICQMNPFTLRRDIRIKKLHAIKISGKYRIKKENLEKYIKEKNIIKNLREKIIAGKQYSMFNIKGDVLFNCNIPAENIFKRVDDVIGKINIVSIYKFNQGFLLLLEDKEICKLTIQYLSSKEQLLIELKKQKIDFSINI